MQYILYITAHKFLKATFLHSMVICFCLITATQAMGGSKPFHASLKFTWTGNDEPDLAGYYFYYGIYEKYDLNSDSPHLPNRYKQDPGGVKREALGKVTSHELPELTETGIYFFSVTAYDGLNLESEPSNVEKTVIINHEPLSLSIYDFRKGKWETRYPFFDR